MHEINICFNTLGGKIQHLLFSGESKSEGNSTQSDFMFNQLFIKGIARTQSPTNKNYALELPTFGVIVGVSPTGVQWRGLALEEPPS